MTATTMKLPDVLAQADAVTAKAIMESADFLSGKDAKWWFVAVLILFGIFSMLALRWLLASHQKYIASMESQLTEQRKVNVDLYARLLDYNNTDRMKMMEMMSRVSDSLEKLATAIDDLEERRG